jgi:hypothetical protein
MLFPSLSDIPSVVLCWAPHSRITFLTMLHSCPPRVHLHTTVQVSYLDVAAKQQLRGRVVGVRRRSDLYALTICSSTKQHAL